MMQDSSSPGPPPPSACSNQKKNGALLIFSAPLAQKLSTPHIRIEPTYVGVRRVRPSSRVVQNAMRGQPAEVETGQDKDENGPAAKGTRDESDAAPAATATHTGSSAIVYKVLEKDGTERRMTKQEKKARKLQLLQQRKIEKQERKELLLLQKQQLESESTRSKDEGKPSRGIKRSRSQQSDAYEGRKNDDNVSNNDDNDAAAGGANDDAFATDTLNDNLQDFSKVGKSSSLLVEQELADLRGEREGVPPVMLSPALAKALLRATATNSNNASPSQRSTPVTNDANVQVDDDLARQWATALTASMEPALDVRGREDMRAMKYAILPEVWTRLRPATLDSKKNSSDTTDDSYNVTIRSNQIQQKGEETEEDSASFVSIRPPSLSTFDSDLDAVVQALRDNNNSLYLSCGAKFGCDLLLYDGPRSERHAFAGLRLVTASSHQGSFPPFSSPSSSSLSFPVPSAYCIAGYVRCLNTAGKLALLATVRRETTTKDDGSSQTDCRVALVDLKLERIDGTKRKDMEQVLQKLDRSAA